MAERVTAGLVGEGGEARRLMEQGIALRRQGRLDEAARAYEAAIAIAPAMAEAHYNLGNTRRIQGRTQDAIACWQQATALRPNFVEAHNNLGTALLELGLVEDAIACHRRALAIEAQSASGLVNLGNALRLAQRPDEAAESYDRALGLVPKDAATWGNLGLVLQDLGRLDEAEDAYRRAIEIKPDYAEVHKSLALLLLLTGRYAEGWAEYGWRWRTRLLQHHRLSAPAWRGEVLAGRTLLLHAEQGLGDTIMACRLAAGVAARGARVVLEVPPELVRLLQGLAGVEQILPRGAALPRADVAASLFDLPGPMRLDATNIPAAVPYLTAEPGRVAHWRAVLGERPGLKVGIVWQGNRRSIADLGRSPPLAAFAPLAALPGVRLIALQKGDGCEQLAELPAVETLPDAIDAGPDAFLDTAAIMASLDLVISADTAPAHLAGALGRPLWAALKRTPDWRWLLDRDDNPWYPTARLFRQERAGDWQPVFARMAQVLRDQILAQENAGGEP